MKSKKKMLANNILNSIRGQYLLSQALCIAVKVLRKQPKQFREVSNIADMELLIEQVYPIYRAIEQTKELKKDADQNESK
jgi:hypothetical protein